MATIDMTAVQFYDSSTTAPSLSARCAATLQQYRQFTGLPHRKERDRVLKSYKQSQTTYKDTAGKDDNPSISQAPTIDEDDEFLPVDEVIRQGLHREDSIDRPSNSALASHGTDETSFLDGNRSSKLAHSSLLSHLGSTKEQPVILDDDDDNSDNDTDDDGKDSDNHEDTINSSNRDISSNSKADDTSQELGSPPSPTTSYPDSRPSSSCDPSLHPSTAPHDQSLKDQAIEQDGDCISREMLEEPGHVTPILLDDKDDETEKGQQQEAVEGREKEACNSDITSSGENHLQVNDVYKGLSPAKQRKLSPSYDPTIKSCYKRRLQHFDESVSTIQPTQQRNQERGNEKEQETHNNNSVYSNCGYSDYDSEDPLPIKRRRPSPSSSHPTSKYSRKQRLQPPHISSLRSQSTQANAGLVLARSSDDCAQSQDNSTHSSKDSEPISTTAEYQEWPIRGVLKRAIVGDEVRYGLDFSLEEPHAITCPQHTVAHQSADEGDPQPGDSWDIHKITDMRNIDGVEEFRVAWAQTWMHESDLGGAKELIEEFMAKLSVRQRNKNRHGKTNVTAEKPSKRRRGRPRKQ